MGNERKEKCIDYFRQLKGKGKSPDRFDDNLIILQEEAATNGLDNSDIKVIADVIRRNELRAGLCVPLVKCLIPKNKLDNNELESMILYWLADHNVLPVTVSTHILQWFIGLWEYQLSDRQLINTYYDCFFYYLLKRERTESVITRLVYLLTKPYDVTRRQVRRLLKHQEQYPKPPKHISALLSLFKSYKPELVPEKIPSLNLESVWKSMPDAMRSGFEDAKHRCSGIVLREMEIFDWNPVKMSVKDQTGPLLPSMRYFQMGSSIYKDQDTKTLFELNSLKDIGKYHFQIELPSNAISLLANNAGYHCLTFASYEFQSRFSFNLYLALRRAFIIDCNAFSYGQKAQLLDMTTEFCKYMKQGIPVFLLFFMEYYPYDTGEFRSKLLGLFEWSTTISVAELQDLANYFDSIFLESSLKEKCELIRCFQRFSTNLFINQRFDKEEIKPSPFLGQVPMNKLTDLIPIVLKIVDHFLTNGLSIHNNSVLLLDEGTTFYENMNRLASRCEPPWLIIAPPSLIYGGFVSKSAAILSQVCDLLLKYRKINNTLVSDPRLKDIYQAESKVLEVYTSDLGNALWNDQTFSLRREGQFLSSLPDKMVANLPRSKDYLLNISNHIAILPCKSTLISSGLDIRTKDLALCLTEHYLPPICEFVRSFDDYESENET
ncbi:centromere protein I [Microplitis demolitor]|uniref:centromere protein I n=1 Tax=Microplitis demolitor TaxID=69319 RepID=UPI0004CDA62C|nr:centromere protein I [Microplitis demolitor]